MLFEVAHIATALAAMQAVLEVDDENIMRVALGAVVPADEAPMCPVTRKRMEAAIAAFEQLHELATVIMQDAPEGSHLRAVPRPDNLSVFRQAFGGLTDD
jgi:hypothetical protein